MTQTSPITTLHDAIAEPWKAQPEPNPTAEELNLLTLAKLYAAADCDVQRRIGTTTAVAYQTLTARRKELVRQLLRAAAEYRP